MNDADTFDDLADDGDDDRSEKVREHDESQAIDTQRTHR